MWIAVFFRPEADCQVSTIVCNLSRAHTNAPPKIYMFARESPTSHNFRSKQVTRGQPTQQTHKGGNSLEVKKGAFHLAKQQAIMEEHTTDATPRTGSWVNVET